MVLVWGLPGDPPLDAVLQALWRERVPTQLIDQRRWRETAVAIEVGAGLAGALRVGDRTIELNQLSGFYLRPQDRPAAPPASEGPDRDAAGRAAAVDELLLIVAELSPAVVLNRPAATAGNGSKPYQYSQIRGAGFRVPETLITTSPEAAREFVARHGRVIYKSVSGVRSIVSELSEADSARMDAVSWCPTQLQERIAGVDVRVHVVGEQLFACEIWCDAVDYRYAHLVGRAAEITSCGLPDDCAERCLALSRQTALPLSGIDLRRTDDGEWVCFEINPSPGFTYYQHATGAPIDEAIAALLKPKRLPANRAPG